MKIGILTYHRAENYGALLQAYALMTYLKSLGHDVLFVDYWPKYHSNYFGLFPWQMLKNLGWVGKLVFILRLLLWGIPRFIRKKRLQGFMYEKLELSKNPLYTEKTCQTEKFDLVVYGSDQIWRKQNLDGVGFDDWYFGSEHVLANKKIVYAGSMGAIHTTVQDDEYVQQMMRNFNKISVREKDLQSYLDGLGVFSSLVIDPVFLLSKQQWSSLIGPSNKKENYILFYNLLNTSESKSFANRLSKETGLPIREITKKMDFRHIGKKYICSASVERFLQLIDGAEYVVSNSFHGVAMSILFEKQFYATGMRQKSNRVESLLQSLGISERYEGKDVWIYTDRNINYKEIGSLLLKLSDASKNYLQHSIN